MSTIVDTAGNVSQVLESDAATQTGPTLKGRFLNLLQNRRAIITASTVLGILAVGGVSFAVMKYRAR